ncbi:hypothetical protein NC652_034001 [Populus alba x Populus x berolinensis]|uniref:Transmembrane protein n=1 Tax=Populus alba x Populus x berolinensis TaxID=444605 RepID=A0AAD6LW12_9ROSI|nr:hypothetical protein NC652_034001 [Populus alba x Populus x berolinensis]KAJ6973709.1 hypothetical protein NC653_033907 [Populus alba x Populus x berolinensis]
MHYLQGKDVYLEARRKQRHAFDLSPLLSFVFLLVPLILSFFLFLFAVLLAVCSLSFFLPATLCFFYVLSSSVLPVFFLPLLSLTLLLYPLSISLLSRYFLSFFSSSPAVFFFLSSVILPSPPPVQSSSAAFIGQRRLCAGNGWLDNGLQGDDSRETRPLMAPLLTSPSIIAIDSQLFEDH